MAINSFPSQAGGGQANLNFIGSVHMETYNRSWAQGGSAGYYALYSTNQENGYAYFVGTGTSTGAPLNRLVSVTHAFTRIDIIAPTNDMISLYKAEVKSTTVFNNPFDADGTIGKLAIPSFPSIIRTSGNFVLPNNALPLVNTILTGGGGGGGGSRGGGGGGAGVVKLTAFQAVGTTAVTIGGGGSKGGGRGGQGGLTYFGNVYAIGGSGGGHHNHNGGGPGSSHGDQSGANGGGAGGHSSGYNGGGPGPAQTANTGLGFSGSPVYLGGHSGGNQVGGGDNNGRGGGGGGAGGNGENGNNGSGGTGGVGHEDSTIAPGRNFGLGGYGAWYGSHANWGSHTFGTWHGHGGGGGHHNYDGDQGGAGGVVVRYYIP